MSVFYRLEFVDVDDIDGDAGQIVFDFEGERLISSLSTIINVADLNMFFDTVVSFYGRETSIL